MISLQCSIQTEIRVVDCMVRASARACITVYEDSVAHRQAIWYTEDTNGKGSILYWKYKTIYNGIPHSAPPWNWNCGIINNT